MIIILVGMPASGKSYAAKFIKKKFKAFTAKSGDIIRKEIKRRGWKYNPETSKIVREWFHPKREKQIVNQVWKKIKNKKGLIIVDGFRSRKEVNLLEELAKQKIPVIAITASFKVRAKRSRKRGRFGKLETEKYLKVRDKSENKIGLGKLIKKADYKINNSKLTKKQFENKILKLLNKLI